MSEFVMDRTKSEFDMRVSKKMSTHLEKPAWSPKQKLALSARILANQGHGSGLAGQVTARGEKPGTMWTGRFGLGLEEFRASNFLLVDEDLNALRGRAWRIPLIVFIFGSIVSGLMLIPSYTRTPQMCRRFLCWGSP